MSEVIRLENVSKRFIIHHERHRSFQDMFVRLFRSNGSREEFWALRDVSFSICKGETVGIIGQNGSGKSTALKLISRIIEPTRGKITVNGTISSLLELGAGFHPELTGRENVFLNGSLLGFSRRMMRERFDEIVEFAEMQQFIDMPVKHYSSGMYMRLAFAVAINVDPDILLIDEVLAVGDLAFQEKCMDRIKEFQRRGKTIVLVSHALESVKNICHRAIWLDGGRVRAIGDSRRVVLAYQREVEGRLDGCPAALATLPTASGQQMDGVAGIAGAPLPSDGVGRPSIRIKDIRLCDTGGSDRREFNTGEDMIVRLGYEVADEGRAQDYTFAVSIADANGTLIHRTRYTRPAAEIEAGGVLELRYESIPLLEGLYTVAAAAFAADTEMPPEVQQVRCRFAIKHDGGGQREAVAQERQEAIGQEGQAAAAQEGIVALPHKWRVPSPVRGRMPGPGSPLLRAGDD